MAGREMAVIGLIGYWTDARVKAGHDRHSLKASAEETQGQHMPVSMRRTFMY